MAIVQSDPHHPGRAVQYLKTTRFCSSMGPKKAALISGILTTFQRTRTLGVKLFENNYPALLEILSTSKYDAVRTAAADVLSERTGSFGPCATDLLMSNMSEANVVPALSRIDSRDALLRGANSGRDIVFRAAVDLLLERGAHTDVARLHGRDENRDSFILERLAANLNKIEETPALMLIGRAHRDIPTRVSAITKIRDSSAAMEITRDWKTEQSVSAALEKLTPAQMMDVHKSSPSKANKERIIKKLGTMLNRLDDRALRLVAGWHDDPETCRKAAGMVTDIGTLEQMTKTWHDRYGTMKIAVGRIPPLNLARMLHLIEDKNVRKMALERLGSSLDALDDNALMTVAGEHHDGAVCREAASRIKDMRMICEILSTWKDTDGVAGAIISENTPDRLAGIYHSVKREKPKEAILAKLSSQLGTTIDQNVLFVLCEHGDADIRMRAARSIRSAEKLRELAASSRHADVAGQAAMGLEAVELWGAFKTAKGDHNRRAIMARLNDAIPRITDENILKGILEYESSNLEKVRRIKRSAKKDVIYEYAIAITDTQAFRLAGIAVRLGEIFDGIQDKDLAVFATAFTQDERLLDKAIARFSKEPNWLAAIAVFTSSTRARDRILGMIKNDENALALVGRQACALPDTDQKAIDMLGQMGNLQVRDSIVLVGGRCSDKTARNKSARRIMIMSYEMGRTLINKSYEGYNVSDAIDQAFGQMRKFERIVMDIRDCATDPETKKYASALQDEIIDDWNKAVHQSRVNMAAKQIERILSNLQRSIELSQAFGSDTKYRSAFQDIRMPGERTLERIERAIDRIF